jgi:hypothetical protein
VLALVAVVVTLTFAEALGVVAGEGVCFDDPLHAVVISIAAAIIVVVGRYAKGMRRRYYERATVSRSSCDTRHSNMRHELGCAWHHRCLGCTVHLMLRCAALVSLALAACGDNIHTIGPAPLRRMSNTEYTYALSDLFPTVAIAIPPLPADAAVAGFDNEAQAQQPSDLRISRFEEVANLYAEQLTKDSAATSLVTGCSSWQTPTESAQCSATFIRNVGARLFRRPLHADEEERLLRRFSSWAMSVDFLAAVQLTLSAMLQSPQFLYRAEPTVDSELDSGVAKPVEPYAMASRLSFFLWESVPDDELLAAAARGELQTVASVREHATRMLNDSRALRVTWDFHRQWLALDRILNDEHDVRAADIDPAWSAATKVSALHESRLFIENSFQRAGTFADLMTSRSAWVDSQMSRVYGVSHAGEPTAWNEVILDNNQRAGILTRAAFLAGTSHRGGTSPPVRGNAVMLRLLCKLPAPPPPDADLSMPMQDPNVGPQTNRQLFEDRTATPKCQQCHKSLNGFGFGFENYTASGRYVTDDKNLPIDSRGVITGTDDDRSFANAVELSMALQQSRTVYRCAASQWLRYALGRAITDDESYLADDITDAFVASHGDIRELLLNIVSAETFRMRKHQGQQP